MRKVKLSDVCDISSGGTPSRSNPEYFKGDIPWAKISDIENAVNGVVYDTEEHISIDGLKNIRGKLFPKGTLLFAMYGSIGKVGICGRELSTNQAILGIRPRRDDEIDLNYLKTWFSSNKQRLINQGRGVALKNLSATIVRDLEIDLPDFDDQIRIAHLLGKVEGLIAQRNQHLQQLDELLKSVFLQMFGDPVRNEKGWNPTTIGDSVEIQSGQVDPREFPYSEMLHVGGANIESESGNFINLKQAKYENLISGKYLFDDAYILYSKIRPYLNKVAKPDFEGICSADIYPIKPIGGLLNRDFLRFLFLSKLFLNYTANNSDRANIPKINRKALIAFRFNRPPIDLQNQFAAIVEKVETLKSRYQQSLSDLEALYGALSQQAFKGELDLSRVPLPKPPAQHIAHASLGDQATVPDARAPAGHTGKH